MGIWVIPGRPDQTELLSRLLNRLTELVENTLSAGRVAVAVACNTSVHLVVVNLGIDHGLDTGLKSKLCIERLVDDMVHRNEKMLTSVVDLWIGVEESATLFPMECSKELRTAKDRLGLSFRLHGL